MQEGLGGAALSAGTTFTGALANVKAALSRLGETAATPVLDGLRGLFNQAIPLIDTFTAAVTPTPAKSRAALQQGLENAIPATQAKLKNLGDTISNIPGFQMLASATASLKKPTHWPLERNHITHRRTQQWRRSLQKNFLHNRRRARGSGRFGRAGVVERGGMGEDVRQHVHRDGRVAAVP